MNFKVFAVFALALVAQTLALQSDILEKFEKFQREHGKLYRSGAERSARLNIFKKSLEEIERHNNNPNTTYRKGITKFADLTDDEFKQTYLGGYKKISGGHSSGSVSRSLHKINVQDLPKNVDWRERGAITPVKDQMACGSCWAFTTSEMIESYLAIATGKNDTILSPQQLVSCMPNPLKCGGIGGCSGAIAQVAFNYIQLFGMVTEETIPYVSGTTSTEGECTFDPTTQERVAFIRGYETLERNNIEVVMNHLANVGPLAMGADASNWKLYESGIFDGCDYNENIFINHALQLIGYGTDEKLGDYWLVRNSWGPTYGENGFIRLKREAALECGVDSTPALGTACHGDGFSAQKTCGMCGLLFDTSYPIGAMPEAHIEP